MLSEERESTTSTLGGMLHLPEWTLNLLGISTTTKDTITTKEDAEPSAAPVASTSYANALSKPRPAATAAQAGEAPSSDWREGMPQQQIAIIEEEHAMMAAEDAWLRQRMNERALDFLLRSQIAGAPLLEQDSEAFYEKAARELNWERSHSSKKKDSSNWHEKQEKKTKARAAQGRETQSEDSSSEADAAEAPRDSAAGYTCCVTGKLVCWCPTHHNRCRKSRRKARVAQSEGSESSSEADEGRPAGACCVTGQLVCWCNRCRKSRRQLEYRKQCNLSHRDWNGSQTWQQPASVSCGC